VKIARRPLDAMLAATVALAVLVVTWTPRPAFAQAASAAPLGADAGGDVDALQAALDRDYAQAMANDCALACRALESMRRSAERLCQLDPGERCARAKGKVDAATTRVRSSCPTCPEQLDQNLSTVRKAPDEAPQPTAGTTTYAAEEVSVSKRGGCAGCTSAPAPIDAFEPLALAAVALAAGRRLRRRSHLGGSRR
jgi:hypothetical protein